jgi:hypothetical protein
MLKNWKTDNGPLPTFLYSALRSSNLGMSQMPLDA